MAASTAGGIGTCLLNEINSRDGPYSDATNPRAFRFSTSDTNFAISSVFFNVIVRAKSLTAHRVKFKLIVKREFVFHDVGGLLAGNPPNLADIYFRLATIVKLLMSALTPPFNLRNRLSSIRLFLSIFAKIIIKITLDKKDKENANCIWSLIVKISNLPSFDSSYLISCASDTFFFVQ